jgi:hypothetical protein
MQKFSRRSSGEESESEEVQADEWKVFKISLKEYGSEERFFVCQTTRKGVLVG